MNGSGKGKQRIAQAYQYENHRRPRTRREFFAQGFASFGATLAMPSLLSLLESQAFAAELSCSSAASIPTKRMVPFIIFDLAGGANIAGTNVIAGALGGQDDLLPAGSYRTMGLTREAEPSANGVAVNTELGLKFHPSSKMLAGILATTSATTRAGIDGALFCTRSNDDTQNNPHNPLFWIAKAGLGGQLVSLVGTNATISGGNSVSPESSIDGSKTPSRITRATDALGLVDPGKLVKLLAANNSSEALANAGIDVAKILDATKTMSAAQLARFSAQDLSTQLRDLVRCGYVSASDLLTSFTPASVDPTVDLEVNAVFNQPTPNADEDRTRTIAKLVLEGYAGAGVIALGGYDYHGQGRASQDNRDLEAGRMIGRVLELAALKETPVMIYVYTDGGVSTNGGSATNGIYAFTADSGERSAAFSLVYRPGEVGKANMIRNGRRQIGAYQSSGAVDATACKISTSVENLGKALVANYLALHGREGELAKIVGADPFGAELESYLSFTKII